jgi:hypothetical protein
MMECRRTDRMTGCLTGPQCPCGARAGDNGDACIKCAARARWMRRKAWRVFRDDA